MNLKRLLTREDGIALPTAIMVLTLCLLLTAVVAEGADQLSTSSGADQRGKRALAAADAGIDVAIRRLRALPDLNDAHCLTTTGVPQTGGACPSTAPEPLGGGASFTYVVSPASVGSPPVGCYQVPGQTIPASYIRRCITATGRAGNEIRRVQQQVASPPRATTHWMGILGLDYVKIHNSARLSGCWSDEVPGPTIGSNLTIEIDNSAILNADCPSKVWGVQMPPGKTPSIHPDAQPAGQIPVSSSSGPFTIPAPPRDFEDVENSNANARLTIGGPDIVTSGSVTWNATSRVMRLGNSASVRLLRGGDYTFCQLYLDQSASFDVSTTEKTRIWIDHSTRPGSNCAALSPAGGAAYDPRAQSRMNWPSTVSDTNITELTARSKNLEIYSYVDVLVRNGARTAALIHADRSTVHYVNGSLTMGAVAAKRVIVENSGNFQRPVGLLNWAANGPPYRSAGWTQCRSLAPPATTPHAGC